ncbi:MAG: rod shape-determining protein MreC [Myxococcales bacterium]|nr:rod shape-determining protein MreC [Myxococcales bacterium]
MNWLDQSLMRVAAPVQYAAAALGRGVSHLVGDYVYLVDVKRDNNELYHEVSRLRAETRELARVRAENKRLRSLLGLRDTVPAETASALVIGKDTNAYFRVAHIVLDHPGVAVRQNMPVVALDGAVGVIKRVVGDSATVQLVVDSGFGADVVVERTGARGFVRGIGDDSRYVVRVEYVGTDDGVEVGDLLVTSGKGCRFPAGIPVARVTEVVKRDFGIYQSVEAEPTVDFSRLDEVLIVLTEEKEDCGPAEDRRRVER